MKEQAWFEMREIRRRQLNSAVWVPLRASQLTEDAGLYGDLGHVQDYFGAGSLAIPLASKDKVATPDWHDIGPGRSHRHWIERGVYLPADVHSLRKAESSTTRKAPRHYGVNLVLEQRTNRGEHPVWHLHQDLVFALGLKREGDIWLAANEGYVEIARLKRKNSGDPALLEIRAEHLKDYLRARKMALCVTSYRDRRVIVEDRPTLTWEKDHVEETDSSSRWVGQVSEMHEGGHGSIAVFKATRTDVDPDADVPDLDDLDPEKIATETYTVEPRGKRVLLVRGELWRTEWVDPADQSSRVRGDSSPPTSSFFVDAEGRRESRDALLRAGKWLWFRPQVMMALAHRRGGGMGWYTRDTGHVGCSPDDHVVFGVNRVGLINVYAKDIAELPDWQQREWAGHNVTPEGKVSEELLASQARGEPAKTVAPESHLAEALAGLREMSRSALGVSIVRESEHLSEVIARCHRFRAVDEAGLLALAKDICRITSDNFDVAALRKLLGTPDAKDLGSLRCFERVLAKKIDPGDAKTILTPLAGINDLRQADAHLKSTEWKGALELVGIDGSLPTVHQGHRLILGCMRSLAGIARVLDKWDEL